MQLGVFHGTNGDLNGIDGLIAGARAAADAGFPAYWIPQLPMGLDALTALSVAGAEVDGITFGTAVVPTYPRHPLVLGQQALTTNAVLDGRLALGIGLSHKVVIEQQYGMSFDKPVGHLREYLDVLIPVLEGQAVQVEGETISANNPPMLDGSERPALYVAALGPQMLKLTGRTCDGTITWMTGTETLRDHTVPTIRQAADDADRPAPKVIAGVPIACTDDVDGAREFAAKAFKIYGRLPSYRAMLDREGLAGPEDFCIIGSEQLIADRLGAMFEAGCDEIICSEFARGDDAARTRVCLESLL